MSKPADQSATGEWPDWLKSLVRAAIDAALPMVIEHVYILGGWFLDWAEEPSYEVGCALRDALAVNLSQDGPGHPDTPLKMYAPRERGLSRIVALLWNVAAPSIVKWKHDQARADLRKRLMEWTPFEQRKSETKA